VHGLYLRSPLPLAAALVFGALLTLAACGDDSGGKEEATDMGMECTPGTSYTCQAPGGCSGRQHCTDLGYLTSCRCDETSTDTDSMGVGDGGFMMGGDPGVGDRGDGGGLVDTQSDAGNDVGNDAGTQTSSGGEICDNGSDDDGDGDIDCADSDCSALRCVEPAPEGWQGPLMLAAGVNAPPACSGALSEEALAGGANLTASAASCSSCSCSPGSCSYTWFVHDSTDTSCSASVTGTGDASGCTLFEDAAASKRVRLKGTGASACTPSSQSPSVPDASFGLRVRACQPGAALEAQGCGGGQLCMPRGAAPYDSDTCILQAGEHACPAGVYSLRSVFYTDIDDSRGCSDCSCGAENCDTGWNIYAGDDASCTTVTSSVASTAQCHLTDFGSGSIRVGPEPGGGSCTPSGGEPTGTASGSGATTVCCAN